MDLMSNFQPTTMVADGPIKRQSEDEEPFDTNRSPSKRQVVEATLSKGQASTLQGPSESTEPQLYPKTQGELISVIHEMKASHAQQVADLKGQYAVVSQQLEQLKNLLNTHLTSQMTAIEYVQSVSAQEPYGNLVAQLTEFYDRK